MMILTPWPTEDEVVRRLARRLEAERQHSDLTVSFEEFSDKYGWTVANRIWQRACESFDWHNAPEEYHFVKPAGAVSY